MRNLAKVKAASNMKTFILKDNQINASDNWLDILVHDLTNPNFDSNHTWQKNVSLDKIKRCIYKK